jgi:hypothetical protein
MMLMLPCRAHGLARHSDSQLVAASEIVLPELMTSVMPKHGYRSAGIFRDLHEALRFLRICNRVAFSRCDEQLTRLRSGLAEGTMGTMALNNPPGVRTFGWVRRMLEAVFAPLE